MKNPVLLLIALTIGHAGAIHADDHHRVAFVTSVTGSGDLSTWTDAGGQTGLAAGDAVCQSRAQAAGLANPGNFVAWLSDDNDDAYCRLHGLSGKRADNCGQAGLPAAAGPWVRTDGFPFSADIEGLTASGPVVFTPLRFNEYGAELPTSEIATGTFWTGGVSFTAGQCDNWTVGIDDGTLVTVGSTSDTGRRWTGISSVPCDTEMRLACLERVAGPELPPFEQHGRVAFVTSVFDSGDLSAWPQAESGTTGIDAGDSICQTLADDAGLAGAETFKAWLSDADTDAIDRFENDGPWVRVDGVPIADNKADLTDGLLFTAILVTEEGQYRSGTAQSDRVWTGTNDSGLKETSHCDGWTEGSSAESGKYGRPYSSDSRWTQSPTATACFQEFRLYCLSDAVDPIIFNDRFE